MANEKKSLSIKEQLEKKRKKKEKRNRNKNLRDFVYYMHQQFIKIKSEKKNSFLFLNKRMKVRGLFDLKKLLQLIINCIVFVVIAPFTRYRIIIFICFYLY